MPSDQLEEAARRTRTEAEAREQRAQAASTGFRIMKRWSDRERIFLTPRDTWTFSFLEGDVFPTEYAATQRMERLRIIGEIVPALGEIGPKA